MDGYSVRGVEQNGRYSLFSQQFHVVTADGRLLWLVREGQNE